MSPGDALMLIAAGFVIGAYAGAIGTGGGFLIAPLLLLRHADAAPSEVTAASLAVVAMTSISASLLAAREGRVDRPLVLALVAIAIPAALLGAVGTGFVPRRAFAAGFAALLLVIAAYTIWRPVPHIVAPAERRAWRRRLVDREGNVFSYRIPVLQSIVPMVTASFLSALAGIGGGPLGVPIMTRIMRVPHAITVPSMHMLFAVQATAVVAMHFALGNVGDPMRDVPWLGVGVIAASPLARWLRLNLGERRLMQALAIGLVFVAARTAWAAR